MRNIIKLASLLDRAGKYNLADKLDKIAQIIEENPQAKYKEAIEDYKEALSNKAENSENIITDFNNWCDYMYNQTKNVNNKKYYKQLKYNFGKHAERLKIFYMPENRFYDDNSLIRNIKVFGLETAKNVDEFNARWKQFTDYSKKRRFKGDPQTGPTIYKQPGVQQQLAALYNQLKSKYTNPVKSKSQQPTKKENDTENLSIDTNGELSISIPDKYN
jgi:hypothetical protein